MGSSGGRSRAGQGGAMAAMATRSLLLSLCLLCLALFLVSAKHPPRPPLPEISPFTAAALGDKPTCCPTSPFRYCDFFFEGYEHNLPTFHLKDGIYADHALSPISRDLLHWKGVLSAFSPPIMDRFLKNKIFVSSSWKNGTFLQCPSPLPEWINSGNQFFVTADQDSGFAKLHGRQFQRATKKQHGRHFYQGRCVLLPLTSVAVPTAGKPIELLPLDGKTSYPEPRRCVVFKTQV